MTETATPVETVTEEEEELDWNVNDPDDATIYNEEHGCFTTTLPGGLKVGWDTCGCGRSVLTCGCDPVVMPSLILKMRAQDKREKDALEASVSDAQTKRVRKSTPKKSEPSRGSEPKTEKE